MIIWKPNDPWGPGKGDRCAICRGHLRPPVVAWSAAYTAYFCAECCTQMCHGFAADMQAIKTFKEVQRLGFGLAAEPAAISGGLLFTPETGEQ
jgi:hypothetical protein